jgi:hypothetical protein
VFARNNGFDSSSDFTASSAFNSDSSSGNSEGLEDCANELTQGRNRNSRICRTDLFL